MSDEISKKVQKACDWLGDIDFDSDESDYDHNHFKQEVIALYILAQSRKLVELSSKKEELSALWFYSNWCLHPSKYITPDVKQILDDIYQRASMRGDMSEMIGPVVREFVRVERLREDMKKLFQQSDISSSMLSDEGEWDDFLNVFQKIIRNHPLENKEGNIRKVIAVSEADYVSNIKIEYKTENGEYGTASIAGVL